MRVLVATDGSPAGRAALRFASSLVRGQGRGELVVVTVCAGRTSAKPGARSTGTGPHPELARARRVLADASRVVHGRVASARFELIWSRSTDEVPEAISRHADREKVDLVVVGSEGRESLTEWVVGGTALRLIYVARRPVTVVRAPRRRLRGSGVD